MPPISIKEAQENLPELIRDLTPGDQLWITEDDKPVARLLPVQAGTKKQRQPGGLRGSVIYMASDFDEPLEDFKEYMA